MLLQGGLAHVFLTDDTISGPCPGVAALVILISFL